MGESEGRSQGQVRARPDMLGFGNLRLSVGPGDGASLSKELYEWMAACHKFGHCREKKV